MLIKGLSESIACRLREGFPSISLVLPCCRFEHSFEESMRNRTKYKDLSDYQYVDLLCLTPTVDYIKTKHRKSLTHPHYKSHSSARRTRSGFQKDCRLFVMKIKFVQPQQRKRIIFKIWNMNFDIGLHSLAEVYYYSRSVALFTHCRLWVNQGVPTCLRLQREKDNISTLTL